MTENTQENNSFYSSEEIAEALAHIDTMSPEQYLALSEQATAASLSPLPEARNSINMVCATKDGAELMITVRGISFTETLDSLMEGIKYANVVYGITPLQKHAMLSVPVTTTATVQTTPIQQVAQVAQTVQAPVSQSAQPAPQNSGIEILEVKSVFIDHTKSSNAPYLRVRGGKYVKYGVPAYSDILPSNFQDMYPDARTPNGQVAEYKPTNEMRYAHFDTAAKKVVAFQDHL